MKTSLVRRIEIGIMLCGHCYNTNRAAIWSDRSRLIYVRQGGPSQTTISSWPARRAVANADNVVRENCVQSLKPTAKAKSS